MKQSIVKIDDFKVTIKEITPRDARNLISNVKEVFDNPNIDVMNFIQDKYDLVVDLTKSFIVMPEGKSPDELAFSDIDKIVEEFKKVNKSFLDKMVWMAVLPATPEEIKTETSEKS